MSKKLKITDDSSSYRLVGVVTIGVTHIPIIGLGYPEDLILEPETKRSILGTFASHVEGRLDIDHMENGTDRVTWSVLSDSSSDADVLFAAFLDLPQSARADDAGTQLFTRAAREQQGFLVAMTLEDQTHLCFYDLLMMRKDPESGRLWQLQGAMSKFVSGKAVPLLRTIERLISQAAPQRKIQIPDRELGIIYETVSGALD